MAIKRFKCLPFRGANGIVTTSAGTDWVNTGNVLAVDGLYATTVGRSEFRGRPGSCKEQEVLAMDPIDVIAQFVEAMLFTTEEIAKNANNQHELLKEWQSLVESAVQYPASERDSYVAAMIQAMAKNAELADEQARMYGVLATEIRALAEELGIKLDSRTPHLRLVATEGGSAG